MNSLEIIKSLKGKTNFLLKQMNYDSISEAKSYVDGINGKNNSEKKVLSYLILKTNIIKLLIIFKNKKEKLLLKNMRK
jgi:hypothetical protein